MSQTQPNLQLRHARQLKGWTQEELAQQVDTDFKTVSRWERGIQTPGPHHRQLLCAVFQRDAVALGLLDEPAQQHEADAEGDEPTPSMPIRRALDLPPRIWGFVGRTAQIQTLMDLLRSQHDALAVAVVGMGGVGKSSFVAEILHLLKADTALFPGGITWVRCDQQRGLAGLAAVYDHLLASWGQTLSGNELQNANTVEGATALREHALRSRLQLSGPALVFLDNVEPEFPLTRAWEQCAARGMSVIVTSRHLPAAPRWHLMRLDVLPPDKAVHLFQQRYLERGGQWEAQQDAEDAQEVVAVLGYLPLAIELAAARAGLRQMRPRHLAQEFRAPGVIAKLKDPTDPSVSVRFSFERSLQILTETQRVRFAACSVLDGPDWPRPVVEAAFAAVASSAEAESAGDDVDVLANFSLLDLFARPEVEVESFALRVRLHPLLRELAEHVWNLQPRAVQQTALEAVLGVMTHFALVYQNNFPVLAREEALLVGLLRRATMQPAHQAVRNLIKALDPYLDLGGHWHLYEDLLERCRAIDQQQHDLASEGATLIKLGTLTYNQGRFAEAQGYYAGALAIVQESHDVLSEANIFKGLGLIAMDQGQEVEATRYFTRALDLYRAVHDYDGESRALSNLGWLTQMQGQHGAAQQLYEQALAIAQQSDNRLNEGNILNNLGSLAVEQRRFDDAQAYFEQALDSAIQRNDLMHQGIALDNLGELAIEQGRYDAATEYSSRALRIERRLNDRAGMAFNLNNLGRIAMAQGDLGAAAEYLEEALAMQRALNDLKRVIEVLISQGKLEAARGRHAAAMQSYGEALAIARENGFQLMEGMVLYELGCLAQAQGWHAEATERFTQALVAIAPLEVPHLANQIRARLMQFEPQ